MQAIFCLTIRAVHIVDNAVYSSDSHANLSCIEIPWKSGKSVWPLELSISSKFPRWIGIQLIFVGLSTGCSTLKSTAELYKCSNLAQHQYSILQADSRGQVECTDKIILQHLSLWSIPRNSYPITQHIIWHHIGQFGITCLVSRSELILVSHRALCCTIISSVHQTCPHVINVTSYSILMVI